MLLPSRCSIRALIKTAVSCEEFCNSGSRNFSMMSLAPSLMTRWSKTHPSRHETATSFECRTSTKQCSTPSTGSHRLSKVTPGSLSLGFKSRWQTGHLRSPALKRFKRQTQQKTCPHGVILGRCIGDSKQILHSSWHSKFEAIRTWYRFGQSRPSSETPFR